MSAPACEFFYDFASPYSYLAAMRVDDLLPVKPLWRPIAFGVIVQRRGKVPWSFAEDRRSDFDEIDRAALVAEQVGLLRETSRELFQAMFVEGRDLADLNTVLDAAQRAGLEREKVAGGIQRQEIKERLRAATEEALGRGITGVPTVAVGDALFWGDDRLEDAAAVATG